jgi:hypothetical protein
MYRKYYVFIAAVFTVLGGCIFVLVPTHTGKETSYSDPECFFICVCIYVGVCVSYIRRESYINIILNGICLCIRKRPLRILIYCCRMSLKTLQTVQGRTPLQLLLRPIFHTATCKFMDYLLH